MPNLPNTMPMCRAATQFNIAVDGTMGYDYQGIVEHALSGVSWRFTGVLELLQIIKVIIGKHTPLQPTHQNRTWKKNYVELEREFTVSEQKPEKGREATFLLHVQYHQNTTWQGTVEWLESKKRMPFRSTLELIQLIEQVVGAVKPAEPEE